MSTPEAPPVAPARLSVRRRALIVLVVAIIVAGGARAWHYRTHPEVFPGDGNGIGATLEGQNKTLYVGVTTPSLDTEAMVTITSATPRVLQNTAGATFEFYVCTLNSGAHPDALGAAYEETLAEVCPSKVPVVEGTELHVGIGHAQQLVMAVTVHQAGALRTNGVDLEYSHGWQHGTQAIGEHVKITSR